jgi:hypothetical protein
MKKAATIASFCAVLLGAGASARAASVCVHPTGAGGCQTTIQAAVDLAAPGDEVRIAPGIYYEIVTIFQDKDGLRLIGAGKRATILDGSPYLDRGFDGAQTTLLIIANNVRVQNLGFRNGVIGIFAYGLGATLEGLSFNGTDNPVIAQGSGVQVLGSDMRACWGCVLIQATDALVRNNSIERGGFGIFLERTTRPDRPQILQNRLEGVLDAISATTIVEPVVRWNTARYTEGGVSVSGINPIVEHNRVSGGGSSGVFAYCSDINFDVGPGDDIPAECSRASVVSNSASESLGFTAGNTAPGMVVRGNSLEKSFAGFGIGGTGIPGEHSEITVENNRSTIAGVVGLPPEFIAEPCFNVFTSGALLTGNIASACADAGFLVEGSDNQLRANQAFAGLENGFSVTGALLEDGTSTSIGNVLDGNTAQFNAAQGIAVLSNAVITAVTGNVSLHNRTDFCDEGTETILAGNSFGTTGPCAVQH